MTDSEVKKKLLELNKLDQKYRKQWESGGADIWKLQSELDKVTLLELQNIVEKTGWPTIPKVGEVAAHAAILIAQHSRDIDTSLKFLDMARTLYNQNKVNIDCRKLTNWIDAMNMQRNLPQVYGQYFINHGKGYEIYDIENPLELDERRISMGLEPFDERIRNAIQSYPPEHKESILESYKRIFGRDFKE